MRRSGPFRTAATDAAIALVLVAVAALLSHLSAISSSLQQWNAANKSKYPGPFESFAFRCAITKACVCIVSILYFSLLAPVATVDSICMYVHNENVSK